MIQEAGCKVTRKDAQERLTRKDALMSQAQGSARATDAQGCANYLVSSVFGEVGLTIAP